MMNFTNTRIPGVIVCEPNIINDSRGFFFESFRKDLFEDFIGSKINFCQENLSKSKFGVLRGLHFQTEPYAQSKLVSVLYGKILDVVVDIRKNSKFYGQSFKIELSDKNHKQLFIPKGFAHGFVVLSNNAIVCYKVDNYYNPSHERGINYNDPKLGIKWGIDEKSIIINKKDACYLPFDSNYFFE